MAPAKCTVCNAAYKSKTECNIHRQTVQHALKGAFFCFGCPETFTTVKTLKRHRKETGHPDQAPEGFAFSAVESPPSKAHKKSAWSAANKAPPAPPKCSACHERFETFHELAEHRRTAHGKEPLIEVKCPRCAQKISWGEVHTRCAPPERVACPVCRQKFSPTELAEHRLANVLSCDVCAVHLPPSMSLQDHWRVANRHPYCKMCDNAFRDSRDWVAHTWMCSLARNTLASGSLGGLRESWMHGLIHEDTSDSEGIAFRNSTVSGQTEPAPKTDWFLSGVSQTNPVQSEGSSRRSSLSSLSKATEDAEEHSALPQIERGQPEPEQGESLEDGEELRSTPEPDALDEGVPGTDLVEILAHEYGQHSIKRILSVLEDDDDAVLEKPKTVRSLLPPTCPAVLLGSEARSIDSGYMCDTSLVAHCSSVWDASAGERHVDGSPPMLGCRREARKPALDIAMAYAPSESSSDKVESWLEEQSQLSHTGKPYPHTTSGGAAGVSWHCRACLRQPCDEPVATSCGHVFCQSCILDKLKNDAGCPVCGTEYFVRLEPLTSS